MIIFYRVLTVYIYIIKLNIVYFCYNTIKCNKILQESHKCLKEIAS